MKRTLLALVSALVVAACGGGGAATAPPAPKISFAMGAQNGSTVSGTADVVKSAGSFTLTLKLTGLPASSSHVAHIHAGKCSVPGGVAYALQQVNADASGAATVNTVVPTGYAVPAFGWYVNIHHGPDFSAPANAPSVSCGDMPNH
jgi:hypothetical protein